MTQHPRLKSVRLRVRNLDQMASFYKKVLGLSRQRHTSSSVGLGAASNTVPGTMLSQVRGIVELAGEHLLFFGLWRSSTR